MVARNDITGDEIKSVPTAEYKAGHEKIFGKTKVQRGRWIQHPQTGKLIREDEYVAPVSSHGADFILMDRWDPYESETSGNIISNRRERDYDLKSTGCREYQGKEIELQEANRYNTYKRQALKRDLRETMERTYYEIEHGYRRVE